MLICNLLPEARPQSTPSANPTLQTHPRPPKVILVGDESPAERRDLGVLLMHVGRFEDARAELLRFRQLAAAAGAAGGGGSGGGGDGAAAAARPALAISPTAGLLAAAGQSFEEERLTERLLALLPPPPASSGRRASGGSTAGELRLARRQEARVGHLTLESALAREPPPPASADDARLPLTW